MRLTVLGSSASYPGPGQACAAHLVEAAGRRVLLDCGNGAVSNLGRVVDPLSLDAVFITHVHPDHIVDLYALQALLRYAPQGPAPAMPLFAPTGLLDALGCLLSERGARELADAFVVTDHVAGVSVSVGDLEVTPHAVEHTGSSFALRVVGDGGTLVYTGDTAPEPRLVDAVRDAGLVLAEATLPQAYEGAAAHMTARQAGRLAREAGAAELVLTHIWPTTDRESARLEAHAEFGGTVSIASEMDVFEVPRTSR